MAFELIPFPISIIFALVFAVVWMVVLWKLRKRAKVYAYLFKASAIGCLVLFAIFVYSVLTSG